MRNYCIETIRDYPDNGKHQECIIDLPFQIRKGEDGYYYTDKKGKECTYNIYKGNKIDNRWIVHLHDNPGHNKINPSLERIFNIMVSKDLDKIVDYCFKVYRKSLMMEFDRLVEIEKELDASNN